MKPESQPLEIESTSSSLREFLDSTEMEFLNSEKNKFSQRFEFNDLKFNLIGTVQQEPAWFSASTEISGGWDIYLNKNFNPESTKRELFHEILEIILLVQGYENDEAHKQAQMREENLFGSR